MKRILSALGFLAALGGAGLAYQNFRVAAQTQQPAAPPAVPQAVPVVAAPVVKKPMPVVIGAIGTVQPIATLVVKSRIDGQIAKVHVKDGQVVKAGDPLITLDARVAEAQTRQAEAQVARDRAQLASAKREADRQEALVAKSYASASTYDTARATAMALEASVRADEATLDSMKAQLSYYVITSSIDGRVGTVALREGNNVKANDTITLMTVNQMHPIYVAFSVPQRELLGIRNEMATQELAVTAVAPGHSVLEKGKLAYVDNAVDATTGTISLHAVFENAKERLWPGLYVNVALTLRTDAEALVIPGQSVQVGQEASYVYVIKPDNTVETRTVKVARSSGGESVIASGLEAGEQVVVDGQLRLTKGTLVEPRPMVAANGGSGS